MSYSFFKSKVEALGIIINGKEVELSMASTGSATLGAILQTKLGCEALTLRAHYYEDLTDSFRITGFVDLLYRDNWEFDLRVRNVAGEFDLTMALLVPMGWSWIESFNEIPLSNEPTPTVNEEGEAPADEPITLMDGFGLGTSWILLCNFAGTDPDYDVDVVPGLNFKGDVALLRGNMARIADLAGIETVIQLTGPIDEFQTEPNPLEFMGIRLAGQIPVTMDLGALTVQKAELLLRSPLREGDADLHSSKMAAPGIYLRLQALVDARPLAVVAHYDPLYSDQLHFDGYFEDFAIGGLQALDTSAGAADMEQSFPSEVGPPSGLQLTGFGFAVNLENKALESIYFGVGVSNTWTLVPDWFTVSQLGVRFSISYPFSATKRRLGLALSGVIEIGDVDFATSIAYPSLDFQISKNPKDTLSIGAIVEALAPGVGDLPALSVETFNVEGNARRKTLRMNGMLSDMARVPIGNTSLNVDSIAYYIDYVKGGSSHGALRASLSLGQARADVAAVIGPETVLTGNLYALGLKQLLHDITGNADFPEEMPDLLLDSLSVSYNITKGSFDLLAKASFAYDNLPFQSAVATVLELKVSKNVQDGLPTSYDILLSLSGTGPIAFAEGCSMNRFNLLFTYKSSTGWAIGGGLEVVICDTAVVLNAAYTAGVNGKKLTLSAISATDVTLLDFPGFFALSWTRFDLSIEKSVVEGQADRKAWAVRIDSTLTIPSVAKIGSSIELFTNGAGNKGLKIRPKTLDTYKFAISDGVGVQIKPKELDLLKDGADSSWKLVGICDLGITGVPGKLGSQLPESFLTTITLGRSAAKVEMLNPFKPFEFPLPAADGTPLGKIVLELRSIGVALSPAVGFTAQLGIGFPKELNTYFKRTVFREYEAGNPMSMALLNCSVGAGGIDLKFLTSPFLAGTNKAVSGEDWMHFDFGENGEIALKVPNFKYNVTSSYFEASGGFRIIRPLSIPLTPLHNFLDAVGMSGAKAIFPDKLPVKGISLVDGKNNFKTDELIQMLGDIPGDVETALRGAGNLLNRFPDNFKSYLKFSIPTQLEFKFGFSPLGRVSLGLSAPVEPIRFLYPGMVQGLVPMPGLIGIELRKLSVGTLASGSLFFGEVDAIVDMYDLPSLVTSLALPADPGFPLPTSDELMRRILLRNVFSIIPLSQGVPVPVPVFYDELGFEYKGIEGIGLQAHMGIPQPDFAVGGTALLQSLVSFFKDRNSKLDPSSPPGGQQISFRFRDEYLEAPEYLGGGKVGTTGSVIEIGTWKYVARLMNFCKQFALEEFIAAIPTENRMANRTVKFACFEVDGQYMVTTPEEFDAGGYQALNLTEAQQQDFHDVLPGVQTGTVGAGNGSSGLVMFLRGGVKASSVLDLQASFGLAASGTMGFNTGFKIKGVIGGVVEAELKGALLLNAKDVSNAQSYPASTPVEQPEITMPVWRGDGKVLRLSGFNSWIEVPHAPSMQLMQWSVELWVNLEKPTSDWVGLFGKPGRDFAIYVSKEGALQGYVNRAFERATYAGGAPNGTISFGVWQHIAYTYDGATMCFYRNGVQVGSYAFANEINANATTLYVGRDVDGSFPKYIVGYLSDVRLWRRPRSQAEIQAGFLDRLTGHEANLVAYYPLDADTGEVALDITGLNHGKICNGAFESGKLPFPDGLAFDGVKTQVRIDEVNGFKPGQSTIQIVARVDGTPPEGKDYFLIGTANGALKVHAGLSYEFALGTAAATTRLPRNTYVTITVVSNTTSRTTYVNGYRAKVEQGDYSSTPGKFIFYIGKGNNNATNTVALQGAIAEVSIWNDCKTLSWIKANVNTSFVGDEPNLLVSYKLAHAADGKLISDQGKFPGVVTGMPEQQVSSATATPLGLRFGSNSQYAFVPSNNAFNLPTYTIEFWMRPDEKSSRSQFPLRFPMASPRIPFINGVLSHRWTEAGGATISVDAAASLLPIGQWTHVALTHTGTVGALYVNGLKIGEKTSKQLVASASEFILGRQGSTDSANNFVGRVDEVRIWSIVRSEAAILAGMNASLSGKETGLVANYKLSPADGDLMLDSGPKKLHGTIVGMGLPRVEVAPAPSGRSLVQAYGHAHLKIGSHEMMVADLRIANDEFWFKGKLNLFPTAWPVKVYGDAEGVIGKDKLYLASQSQVQLCGLTLAASRTLITHEQVRIEGQWLGVHTLLDVKWAGDEPHFKGAMEAQYDANLDIGAVYIKGIRVCDGLQLDLSIGFKVALDFDRHGFGATVGATFKINGVGFSASFALRVAPNDLGTMARLVRDEIARNAEKYLSHIFKWAVNFAEAAWNGTLQFLGDTWSQIATTFSKVYGKAAADAAVLWKQVGGEIDQIASLLEDGFNTGLTQASNILKGIGYDIVATGAAIKKFVGENFKDLINALDEAFPDQEVVDFVKNQYNKSMQEIAGWHKELGYATSKTYHYIMTSFNAAHKDLSRAMKNVGYTCKQVGDMLQGYMDGEDGAKLLAEIGYSANEIEGALVSSWGWTESAASDGIDWLKDNLPYI